MDEYVIKQKVQAAYYEPRAPEPLIQATVLRAQAVTMGAQAHKQLETAPSEKIGTLAARVLIGQLAEVSALPKGAQPEQLASQLEQHPAFAAALRGGNIARRLENGDLLRQIVGQQPEAESAAPQMPQKQGPQAPVIG